MKANEASKRIYSIPTEGGFYLTAIKPEPPFADGIEYTRTDAFMKKAENFLEMLGYGFTITDNITHANYDKEQLIDDFIKYMEGD